MGSTKASLAAAYNSTALSAQSYFYSLKDIFFFLSTVPNYELHSLRIYLSKNPIYDSFVFTIHNLVYNITHIVTSNILQCKIICLYHFYFVLCTSFCS